MFTEDFKSVLAEYKRFWKRDPLKRPILNISYAKNGAVAYREANSLEEHWLDAEYKYRKFKHNSANTAYIAEGIPMLFTNYGPGCLSACLGGSFQLSRDSVWFDSVQYVEDWETPPAVTFNEQSPMWQYIVKEQLLCAADPDMHFSVTDLGGVMDIVASLRGTQNLLFDLYDYPDEVKAFSRKVTAQWKKAFDRELEIVRSTGQPYNSWMNIPSEKPWYPLQCDFCYMISPDQFREFVLDDLIELVNYMPRSIYHLDGPGELPHLDMLLDIPNLTGIQWTSGAGNEPLWDEKWFGLYRNIQDKKKNLVLLGGIDENDLKGAERLIKSIDPTGTYISIGCSCKEKAEDMLEKITKWTE